MSRFDLSLADLSDVLGDEPAYRAQQVFDGLYVKLREPDELTDLPKSLRERLSHDPRLAPALRESLVLSSTDGQTTKWRFSLDNASPIETVLMHHRRHSTVCVSSQAGCAMACQFCATGDGGFARHLTSGEIVEQVVRAASAAGQAGHRLDHVVFMGMGEPLANVDAVFSAIDRIIDDIGLAARHITVSTVGVIPGIQRLAQFSRQVNLAVSLHAARDELRDELVPLGRRYPLERLLSVCADYLANTRRRLTFEWALMDQVNDQARDIVELSSIARQLRAHVNLIPLNPTSGGSARGLRGSPPARVRAFRDGLLREGVNATVRRTRGRDIDAACGQLAGAGF